MDVHIGQVFIQWLAELPRRMQGWLDVARDRTQGKLASDSWLWKAIRKAKTASKAPSEDQQEQSGEQKESTRWLDRTKARLRRTNSHKSRQSHGAEDMELGHGSGHEQPAT
jgi:hypothetical protein